MLEHGEFTSRQSNQHRLNLFLFFFSSLPIILWLANGALMLNGADILLFDLLS